jgi:tRNA(Arg) A34 adenosine deaminase TadA
LTATNADLSRLLSCIEDEILPLTVKGVQNGNKVFGAAILLDDGGGDEEDTKWPLVVARSNDETTSTLLHGEVNCLLAYSSMVVNGGATEKAPCPKPHDCIFLSTHEPCCMCISSIVWSGFTRVYYLFGYETTKEQGIPHDINIMHELWGVPSYRRRNQFLSTASIPHLVDAMSDDDPDKEIFQKKIDELTEKYKVLADQYHTAKPESSTIVFN